MVSRCRTRRTTFYADDQKGFRSPVMTKQRVQLIRTTPVGNLAAEMETCGFPAYRGQQLAHWLYVSGIMAWDGMTNLPAEMRTDMANRFDLQGLTLCERLCGKDRTRKYLFRLRDGATIESVLIPMETHTTFCISTQVGCAMACRFCATARGGLERNLEAGEIIEQVLHLRADLAAEPVPGHGQRQFNVVLMGMGEPLDNWSEVTTTLGNLMATAGLAMSPRRIQISTSAPQGSLELLHDYPHPVGLTISLGGTTDAERKQVMPVPSRATLAETLAGAERYARRSKRRVTLAYVLIQGKTDDVEMAHRLASLVKNRPFKINLIPLNEFADSKLTAAASESVLRFQSILTGGGISTFIRVSGGRDIAAACGQLRHRHKKSGSRSSESPQD